MNTNTADMKWVVVTGAAAGIGAGVARAVADAGYGVLLVDRDRTGLEAVAKSIPFSRIVIADLAEPSSTDLIRDAARSVGNAWGLVNCAGIALVKHFLLNSEEEWSRVLRVNLEGTLRASQAVGTVLHENGGGSIVNIASISGVTPTATQAAYAASKAGVIGFTEGLAYDFGPLDITVNVICPGVVWTKIWEDILTRESDLTGKSEEELFQAYLKPIPLGRVQTPEDIANVALFLLGPNARNISGESIKVAGGMSTVVLDHHVGANDLREQTAGRS